jgi:hypothetical protein
MNSLRTTKLEGLKFMESRLDNPTFTWNGGTYYFIPSITDFNRELEKGGFSLVRLMTATVRKFDIDSDGDILPLFNNGYPQPQNKITYTLDGITYKVESVKHDPNNTYFRMIAHSITKGQ